MAVKKKKVAFLYPGQGAQMPGMGLDFYEQNSAAAQPSDFSQLKALFATPLDDRQMVRSLKEGTLRGVARSDMKPSHAIACGVAMAIASFILFFL